jgi:hypothetical protein
VLRGVIRKVVGLGACCALISCTAPNPAYHLENLGGTEAGSPAPPARDGGTPGCGTARVDTGALTGVDSVTIDLHGTLYFNVTEGPSTWIGRLVPNALPEMHWAPVPMGAPTYGLVIDGARNVLYFTAGSAPPVMQAIDLNASTPTPRTIATGFTYPNDLAVGYDGNVYVSEQGDGHIYRFPVSGGARIKVTGGTIGVPPDTTPAGIAFGPDRTLVVGMKPTGQLTRLWLTPDGFEMKRKSFGTVNDWSNGLAFDERGRLYVALYHQTLAKTVVRLDADEATPVTVLSGGRFSSMVFGRGVLDCKDLYVAEPAGTMRLVATDTPGLPVP